MYGQDYGNYRMKQYKPFKERGGCLLIWLIFIIGASFLGFMYIIMGGPQRMIAELDIPGMAELPAWHWTYSAITNLAIVICGIGIWIWKKWGFYGYLLISLIGLIVAFATGGLNFFVILGCAISIGIAWYVVSPYWEDME